MWGAVVALHGRYPRQLQDVKTGWWTDDSQYDTPCALAVWRAEIDEAGRDPAKSSPFNVSSIATPRRSETTAAASPRRGNPGAPPEEWTGR